MRKYLVHPIMFGFFLLCFTPAFSSDTNVVRKYYQTTNQAEALVDSAYKDAITLYEKAFLLKHPNDKDLENAYLAAFRLRDKKHAQKYLDKMASLGSSSYDDYRISGHSVFLRSINLV